MTDSTIAQSVLAPAEQEQSHPASWHPPILTRLGSIRTLTAGGSAQAQSELFGCHRQEIFFRC